MKDDIAVSIVEDDEELRQTLARYLTKRGFRCTSTHGDAEEALQLLPRIKPDVVLMDIRLPGRSGIHCIGQLQVLLPDTKCIVLTAFEDTDLIFEALTAGALGYLLKGVRPAKLLDSIREVYEGGSPMTGQIARKVVTCFQDTGTNPFRGGASSSPSGRHGPDTTEASLSPREKDVLDCLIEGLLYKQIAARLGVSMSTVRGYAQRVYKKLQVHSRMEVMRKHFEDRGDCASSDRQAETHAAFVRSR